MKTYEQTIMDFNAVMLRRLLENRHKGHWLDTDQDGKIIAGTYNVAEALSQKADMLAEHFHGMTNEQLMVMAADTANYALILIELVIAKRNEPDEE